MTQKEIFLQFIGVSLQQLNLHKQIAIECEVDEYSLELHDRVIFHLNRLLNKVSELEMSINYINQFQSEVNQTLNFFPYRQQLNLQFIDQNQKNQIKRSIESCSLSIGNQIKLLDFNFNFFNKLGFFKDNIVAVGANGSGKTSLSNDLKKYLPQNGVVISAQKVLIIPTFSGISNIDNTNVKLKSTQSADKTLKTTYSTESNGNAYNILVQLGGEFQVLLDNLLAERSAVRNKFCDALKSGGVNTDVPITKLDTTLQIWNSLIQHRIIECNDGINITLKSLESYPYPAFQMSDGEKVILYLIAQVLQAPSSGFIIIDEPEMYLHKSILKKLWDVLEKERQDCIFVYLTHELDFATSRTTAKKVWIRSFTFPNTWVIEDIPENDLPEALLLELLGSRKSILFCEGEKGSIDEKIYNLLFPEFTISPVENCFAVINYTKAFNKIQNTSVKAFGIIDSDHHGIVRLQSLKPENIYSFSMAEIENLFLDEDFLKSIARKLLIDENVIGIIKEEILIQLGKDIDLQASNYTSAKINYHFNNSHMKKGNSFEDVEGNYLKFTDEIKIQEWYTQRKSDLEEIIRNNDYKKALSLYNNKGLKTIVNKHFKISDFIDRAIRLIQFDITTHRFLLKYFPEELKH